jgi:two-component sensor histidine kinase
MQPVDIKNNFLSIIKKTRISEFKSKKFVEFEISCQYRVATMKVQKENVYQWSVWRRYSLFSSLHKAMKTALGY